MTKVDNTSQPPTARSGAKRVEIHKIKNRNIFLNGKNNTSQPPTARSRARRVEIHKIKNRNI